MINRILIRIKVIQILYSFLLVEKQFTLERMPSAPTKEKRFAYSLYMDLLVLLIRLSRTVERRVGEYPLEQTRFISRILQDASIKALMAQYYEGGFPFENLINPLAESIEVSGVYRQYLKDVSKDVAGAEEALWQNLFNLVIINDSRVTAEISRRANYTLKGLERMKEMMNRTFVNFMASQDNVQEVQKALRSSLDKARELYFRLLWLPVELTDMQDRVLDENRHKFLASEEDLNPNMRFVDNRVIAELRRSEMLSDYVEKNKLSWLREDPVLMHNLLDAVTGSEIYHDYMHAPFNNLYEDGELWRDLFRNVILENPGFLESLEEKSVFWNDDLEILSTFVMKGLRRIAEGGTCDDAVFQQYKDEEDEKFGNEMIHYLYKNKETYRLYIDDAVSNGTWDKDRLAFMDTVILEAAITELLNFPKIPLNVTVNEYIELAKSYSTHRSGNFVHGILGAVIDRLQAEGLLRK